MRVNNASGKGSLNTPTHGTPPGRHGRAGSRDCVTDAGYGFGGYTTLMRSAAGTGSGALAEEVRR